MDNSYPLDGFSEEQKVLVKAIKVADVDKVRELAAKTDLDLVSEKSVPLLTVAIYEALDDIKSDKQTKRVQIITELVRAGAPVEQRGAFTESPLNMALMQTHSVLLKAMLEGGLDPNYRLKKNYNLPIIFEVLGHHKLNSLKLLIKYGANIHVENSGGQTPFEKALMTAPQTAYFLATSGANLEGISKFTGKSLAMDVFNEEKSWLQSIENIKSGKSEGYLEVIEGNLDAVQKIKAIMIEKGIEWPPKQ
ncbi:hypothetical protein [Pasteurella sp. PK-2025]|uniref:hypothetical protein n=1 Tax=Pasteurella sp. PK-2025 TaxID=3413133 RepID=UPI003C779307